MNVREMETEFKLFCTMSRKFIAARIALGPDNDMTRACREDLEAIAMHSDWPRLRLAASRTITGGLAERVAS